MGKNEHTQVATHNPSPPLLPPVAPQTSSAPGQATGNHSKRLVSSQATGSSHPTYLLLPGIDFRDETEAERSGKNSWDIEPKYHMD